jgi:predicted metalloprotease with PDZ domain
VPDGVGEIVAEFQFVSPTDAEQGRVIASRDMLMLPWNAVSLHPAGHYARRIEIEASLTLPDGWQLACAVERERQEGGTTWFKRTQLDVLVDSPVLAGRYFRSIDLDDGGAVRLILTADEPHQLAASEEQIAPHRALVAEADALFGARHFDHFDMLLAMSGELEAAGIEHHRSCEAVTIPDYFTGWGKNFLRRNTLPHEYVHSWNGKHRRGADSWVPCFEKPIRNSLMWVYEGQTQYWGQVLCARSGLWTAEQVLERLAHTAALYDQRPGSVWRSLADTTRDPIIAARDPLPWTSWQRSEDYYSEGALMWLDVDTRIREMSGGARSLDDFARRFFGRNDGSWSTDTYVFDDVVETLAGIAPFDWAGFFTEALHAKRRGALLDGLGRGGYRLVFRDSPSDYVTASEASAGNSDLRFSVGATVSSSGRSATSSGTGRRSPRA